MRFVYNISIFFYSFAVRCASIFNEKAKKWIRGRKNWKNELKKIDGKDIFWFHCASLGEFEQARPLIEKMKTENQNSKFLITFFSPSGYEIRKNYESADWVIYLPADTVSNASFFVKNLNLKAAFFIKYEFWFNYLNELRKKNIPIFLIAGVFRKNQLFFKSYGKWFSKRLKAFHTFFVQEEESKKLLNEIGYENVVVSGDTRYDKVYENARKTKRVEWAEKFKQGKNILIAGSSWSKEEDILAQFINENKAMDWKFIIAPHKVNEAHIQEIINKLNIKPLLFTQLNDQSDFNNSVLIVDTIGQLSNLYQYGNVAFVGGAFRGALHNILEAATFSLPVVFGPNHQKFPEAAQMIDAEAAFSVTDYESFCKMLAPLTENEDLRDSKGKNARNFIESRRGATEKILKNLKFEP